MAELMVMISPVITDLCAVNKAQPKQEQNVLRRASENDECLGYVERRRETVQET